MCSETSSWIYPENHYFCITAFSDAGKNSSRDSCRIFSRYSSIYYSRIVSIISFNDKDNDSPRKFFLMKFIQNYFLGISVSFEISLSFKEISFSCSSTITFHNITTCAIEPLIGISSGVTVGFLAKLLATICLALLNASF